MTNEQKLRSALLRAQHELKARHHRFDHDTERQAQRCKNCRLLRDIAKTLQETDPNAPST